MTSEGRQAEGRMSVTTEHMLIAVDDKETAPQGVQLHSYSELFREDGMSDSVLHCLSDFKKREILCDVVLIVQGSHFPCHKVVLAARSQYFSNMFTVGMTECSQENVVIHGVSTDIMEKLIDYTYTGQVLIDIHNVQALVMAADLLSFIKLRNACFQFMVNHLDAANCLGVLNIAESFGSKDTYNKAMSYVAQHFEEIMHDREFLEMPLVKIKTVIASDELVVTSELKAFEGIIAWVKVKMNERKLHLAELLAEVRLQLLTVEDLIEKIESEPLVTSDPECNRILHNIKNHHLMPQKNQFVILPGPPASPKRKKIRRNALFVCGGIDSKRNFLKSVECYDVDSEEWYSCADMLTMRGSHGIAVMDGKIYAVGGHDGMEFLDTVEMFDPAENKWENITSMTRARNGAGAAVIGSHLYAIGGRDKSSRHKSCEMFSHETNTWTEIAEMNHGRAGAAVATLHDKIYAVGGRSNDKTYLRSMEFYDPSTGQWSMCKPMETCRYFFSMAVVDNLMYVIGGNIYNEFDDSDHKPVPVEIFDPATSQWEILNIKSEGITLRSICVLESKIVLAGGIENGAMLKTVHCFNTVTQQFGNITSMSKDRGGCGMVAFTPKYTCTSL